jgi:AraC-like DNA-binding protein
MESLFFNITRTRYKITPLSSQGNGYCNRVDISNGIVFFEGKKVSLQQMDFDYLDRMVMIVMVEKGRVEIVDHENRHHKETVEASQVAIFCSSRQHMTMQCVQADVFVLFVADFFLKRYLSGNSREPIDYLYEKLQYDISLAKVSLLPVDALSRYIVQQLTGIQKERQMQSIRAEHRVLAFMIHRFSLLDIFEDMSPEEIALASKAKAILLEDFAAPPTLETLAHRCATNTSKLKKVFKKIYGTTIYAYIQKLRLEEANILLEETDMTIGQIAQKVGYRHQGHFSKLFFSHYGVYPKALLKK